MKRDILESAIRHQRAMKRKDPDLLCIYHLENLTYTLFSEDAEIVGKLMNRRHAPAVYVLDIGHKPNQRIPFISFMEWELRRYIKKIYKSGWRMVIFDRATEDLQAEPKPLLDSIHDLELIP